MRTELIECAWCAGAGVLVSEVRSFICPACGGGGRRVPSYPEQRRLRGHAPGAERVWGRPEECREKARGA